MNQNSHEPTRTDDDAIPPDAEIAPWYFGNDSQCIWFEPIIKAMWSRRKREVGEVSGPLPPDLRDDSHDLHGSDHPSYLDRLWASTATFKRRIGLFADGIQKDRSGFRCLHALSMRFDTTKGLPRQFGITPSMLSLVSGAATIELTWFLQRDSDSCDIQFVEHVIEALTRHCGTSNHGIFRQVMLPDPVWVHLVHWNPQLRYQLRYLATELGLLDDLHQRVLK